MGNVAFNLIAQVIFAIGSRRLVVKSGLEYWIVFINILGLVSICENFTEIYLL